MTDAPPKAMTPEEFRAALKELGMRQVHFAQVTGMSPTTVNRWVKGIQPVPQWVDVLLTTKVTLERACVLTNRICDIAIKVGLIDTIREHLAASGTPPADLDAIRSRGAGIRALEC